MFKKILALLLAALMVCSLAACGKSSSQVEGTQPTDNTSVQEQTETADTENTSEAAETASAIGTVANTLAEDEEDDNVYDAFTLFHLFSPLPLSLNWISVRMKTMMARKTATALP